MPHVLQQQQQQQQQQLLPCKAYMLTPHNPLHACMPHVRYACACTLSGGARVSPRASCRALPARPWRLQRPFLTLTSRQGVTVGMNSWCCCHPKSQSSSSSSNSSSSICSKLCWRMSRCYCCFSRRSSGKPCQGRRRWVCCRRCSSSSSCVSRGKWGSRRSRWKAGT